MGELMTGEVVGVFADIEPDYCPWPFEFKGETGGTKIFLVVSLIPDLHGGLTSQIADDRLKGDEGTLNHDYL